MLRVCGVFCDNELVIVTAGTDTDQFHSFDIPKLTLYQVKINLLQLNHAHKIIEHKKTCV